MNFERFDRQSSIFSEDEQRRLSQSRVAVIGCGGLGSQVIANLVSVGIGAFTLVDPDVVSISNLNRQFLHFGRLGHHKADSAEEWILNADDSIIVEKHKCFLDEGNADSLIADADVVVDCLDNIQSRHVLAQSCRRMKKTLVHAGIEETYGQVSVFLPDSVPKLEDIVFGKDGEKHVSYSPSVSVIASLEADQAVKVLLGHQSLVGVLLTVNTSSHTMEKHVLSRSI